MMHGTYNVKLNLNEISCSLNGGEFFDQMGHRQPTKKDFAARINWLPIFSLFIWKLNNEYLIYYTFEDFLINLI